MNPREKSKTMPNMSGKQANLNRIECARQPISASKATEMIDIVDSVYY